MISSSRAALVFFGLTLGGCVTTGTFQKEQARADQAEAAAKENRARLDDANKTIAQQTVDIDAANKALAAEKATEQDLRAQIKTDEDQIVSIQKSNQELTASLEAKRSELAKRVGELIKDRDAAGQQLADLTKAKDAQISDLNKKITELQGEKDSIQQQKDAEVARIKRNYEDLTSDLKSEIDKGQIQISQLKGRLTLTLVDKILFDSGEAEVKADGRAVLDRVGAALNKLTDKDIRIEGDTDNVPIRGELTKRFATNWELSTARATAVVRYLQDHVNIDPKRLVATGYGEYRPAASNDTPETRAENRRIEIVLVPRD